MAIERWTLDHAIIEGSGANLQCSNENAGKKKWIWTDCVLVRSGLGLGEFEWDLKWLSLR